MFNLHEVEGIIKAYKPNLRDVSITKYSNDIKAIAKMAGELDAKDYDWVHDIDRIMETLKNSPVMSLQSRLTGLRVFIQALGGDHVEKTLEALEPYYREAIERRDAHYRNGEVSEKQMVNRREYSEIEADAAKIIKAGTKKTADYNQRRDAIIAALYTMTPPLRRDYVSMDWIKKADYNKLSKKEREENNWYVRQAAGKAFMFLNRHKSSDTLGSVEIPVPVRLAKTLDKLIDPSEGRQPILGYSGKKESTREKQQRYTGQELTKAMVRILGTTIQNLRSVFVTERVVSKEQVLEDERIARSMLHSTEAQRGFYSKRET